MSPPEPPLLLTICRWCLATQETRRRLGGDALGVLDPEPPLGGPKLIRTWADTAFRLIFFFLATENGGEPGGTLSIDSCTSHTKKNSFQLNRLWKQKPGWLQLEHRHVLGQSLVPEARPHRHPFLWGPSRLFQGPGSGNEPWSKNF